MIKRIKDKKTFTLIEFIVTIAVLGVLVLLASPRFFGHTQNAELTRGFANAKSIEKASELYYMDHEDWPRLTDEPYSSEEIESYSERIFNRTGQEVNLDPEGNYYDIDYDKLSDYIQVPDDKKSYILQNPVGKVFYMENLNDTGIARVNYSGTKEEDDNPIPIGEPINFAYTGRPQSIELGKGTYKLEVWGAQGGIFRNHLVSSEGGLGGYSTGIITIKNPTETYLYSGGRGEGNASAGGYNGGGGNKVYGGSGGGGSDIRIGGTSLYQRVIVAGGGGGGGYRYLPGGVGGGQTGGRGNGEGYSAGQGGTQTSGGTNNTRGAFGFARDNSSNGGAGGGGWYGGSSGWDASSDSSGGGGSGYVLTVDSHKPEGYNVSEEFYLEDTQLIPGNQSMPNPNGGTMVGNSGHGFARITRID